MYEIFAKLMGESGLSISETARRIGIPPSTITDWRAGRTTPKADKILKMAQFYNVSMEYLMTGSNSPENGLSADERKILALFGKMNAAGKSEAIRRLSEMTKLSEYTQKREESSSSRVG